MQKNINTTSTKVIRFLILSSSLEVHTFIFLLRILKLQFHNQLPQKLPADFKAHCIAFTQICLAYLIREPYNKRLQKHMCTKLVGFP